MVKKSLNKYDIGDIVFVKEYKYPNGENGSGHLFVIIDDDGKAIPAEYFGLIVSSHVEKNKYRYNEELMADNNNGLSTDSHVKCDQLYLLEKDYILFKIGAVAAGDFVRFMEKFEEANSIV